jgi:hypothetical protein
MIKLVQILRILLKKKHVIKINLILKNRIKNQIHYKKIFKILHKIILQATMNLRFFIEVPLFKQIVSSLIIKLYRMNKYSKMFLTWIKIMKLKYNKLIMLLWIKFKIKISRFNNKTQINNLYKFMNI